MYARVFSGVLSAVWASLHVAKYISQSFSYLLSLSETTRLWTIHYYLLRQVVFNCQERNKESIGTYVDD
jgi:hypothetical protein